MKEEALKLADELEALHQYVPSEAPAMIRRLVERMVELEKLVHQRFDDGKRLGVLETEDKFKSSPCAWMVKTNDGKKLMLYGEEQPPKFEGEVQYIPLYTTPQTKPLSDDEIKELSELTSDPDPTSFVRAIEERHGIYVQKT